MPARKTHEQFITEMKEIHPDILVLGTYINNRAKLACRCLKSGCGYEWLGNPHGMLGGRGCPKCGGTMKKSHEDFIAEVLSIHPTIVVIDQYRSASTKIKCRCAVDGCEWSVTPNNLLRGHGCPECANRSASQRLSKSHEKFLDELHRTNPNIVVLGRYIDSETKLQCKCAIDNHIWHVRPSDLLRGKGCPECKRVKLSHDRIKPHCQFVAEMAERMPQIDIVGTYNGSSRVVRCRCKVDGFEWDAFPTNLSKGEGCPRCSESKGERVISQWLSVNNIEHCAQYKFDECKNVRPLPFDFYIPSLNMCIEYDGAQHYRPVKFGGCSYEEALQLYERTVRNDAIKNQFCLDRNIILIRIPYHKYSQLDCELQKIFNSKDFSLAVTTA